MLGSLIFRIGVAFTSKLFGGMEFNFGFGVCITTVIQGTCHALQPLDEGVYGRAEKRCIVVERNRLQVPRTATTRVGPSLWERLPVQVCSIRFEEHLRAILAH